MNTVDLARLIRDSLDVKSHVLKTITKAKLDKYVRDYEKAVFKQGKNPDWSEEQIAIGMLLDDIVDCIRDEAFNDYEKSRAWEEDW